MHVDEALALTDKLMVDAVDSGVGVLQQASRHIITAGGKRIRPQILFLSYQAAGGDDLNFVVPIAAAIELVHTATLVHDDINDHGRVRRGRLTVNEVWGRTFALLTGDFLFTKVYSLMAPYGDLNKVLAEATVALVEGETLQAVAVKDNTLNRDIYQRIVAKKTASLFRAAAQLGGMAARGASRTVDALGDYGFYVGLTFQIVDDLLDLTGDPRLMGKEADVDLRQGKGVATAYANSRTGSNGSKSKSSAVVGAGGQVIQLDDDDPFLAIKRRLIEGGAVDEGREMAHLLAIQAGIALDILPVGQAASGLRKLIDVVLYREL